MNTGTFDTVRVTLRRDGAVNPTVPLFFARVLGIQEATVICQRDGRCCKRLRILEARRRNPPIRNPQATVGQPLQPGDTWSAYGDGKLKDANGNDVPGDWGTLDIGATDNSTSELNDQIHNGLRQKDLNSLYGEGRIAQDTHIDSAVPAWMQGDSGLSSGLKSSVQAVHGKQKLIPIYDQLGGKPGWE